MKNNNSLSEKFRPTNWDSIIGNQANINFLKYTVTTKEYNRGYLICGSRGTGKTTAAEIFWRAILCKDRDQDDPNPCGECDVCKGEDMTNITKYDVTDGAEAKANISILKEKANISPIKDPAAKNNPGKRVILINEIQEASHIAQKNLLVPIEDSSPNVIWILVTMEEEKLPRALIERCTKIRMSAPPIKDMSSYIIECLPNITTCGAQAILDLCGAENIRQIWSYIDGIYPLYKDKQITGDLIYNNYGGGCTKKSREKFWRNILGDSTLSMNLLEGWLESNTEDIICDILMRDLYSINRTTPFIRELSTNLAVWKKSNARPPLKIEIKYVAEGYRKVTVDSKKTIINCINDL
jgi:DNA polymerase III delta prime subunit